MEFVETNNQSGLLFREISKAKVSYDSLILVYHIQLTEYFDIQTKTKTCYASMKKVCSARGHYCELTLIDMERKMHRMMEYETTIMVHEPSATRQKRNTIIAVTALLSSLGFGALDQFTMNRYEKMLSELRADYSILHKIQTNETIFMKENIITNKNAFKFLANITHGMTVEFEEQINEAYDELTWVDREAIISKLGDLFQLWYDEHEHISNIIIEHLHNIKHSKMTHLIPIETFKADLLEIESTLTNNQKLPINIHRDNPFGIFNFITTRTSIYNESLYIELTIPKIDKETYNLFKIIPIPIYKDGYILIIIPSTEYVLIDENQSSFTPLSNKEVEDSLLQYDWRGIITPNDNIYHDFHDNCEMSLFIHPNEKDIKELCNVRTIPITNYFISIGSLNQYFVIVTKPTTLIESCNNTITKRETIKTSGKLTLTDDCQIRTHRITLRPRIRSSIEKNVEIGIFTEIDSLTFNHLLENITQTAEPKQLQLKKHSMLIDNHIEEFNQLADQADEIIEQLAYNNRFDEVQTEKIRDHFVVSSSTAIFIMIALGIFACYLYKKFYSIKTWTNLSGKLGNYRGATSRTVTYTTPESIEIN